MVLREAKIEVVVETSSCPGSSFITIHTSIWLLCDTNSSSSAVVGESSWSIESLEAQSDRSLALEKFSRVPRQRFPGLASIPTEPLNYLPLNSPSPKLCLPAVFDLRSILTSFLLL